MHVPTRFLICMYIRMYLCTCIHNKNLEYLCAEMQKYPDEILYITMSRRIVRPPPYLHLRDHLKENSVIIPANPFASKGVKHFFFGDKCIRSSQSVIGSAQSFLSFQKASFTDILKAFLTSRRLMNKKLHPRCLYMRIVQARVSNENFSVQPTSKNLTK